MRSASTQLLAHHSPTGRYQDGFTHLTYLCSLRCPVEHCTATSRGGRSAADLQSSQRAQPTATFPHPTVFDGFWQPQKPRDTPKPALPGATTPAKPPRTGPVPPAASALGASSGNPKAQFSRGRREQAAVRAPRPGLGGAGLTFKP